MKRTWRVISVIIVIGVIVMQFFQPDHSNPPVRAEINAPPPVMTVLRRSCYDCHSNETVWPWYSRIAPVSWLVAGDVEEGRSHLNFSEWGLLSRDMSRLKLQNACNQVKAGEMPLWFYVWMHPESRLSEQDVQTICSGTGGTENPARPPASHQ